MTLLLISLSGLRKRTPDKYTLAQEDGTQPSKLCASGWCAGLLTLALLLLVVGLTMWKSAAGAGNNPPPQTSKAAPTAKVEPGRGSAGTQLTVSGSGFPSNIRVNVYLAGIVRASAADNGSPTIYASGITNSAGAYRLTFTMPATWPDGYASAADHSRFWSQTPTSACAPTTPSST